MSTTQNALEPDLTSLLSKLDDQISEDSKQVEILKNRITKNEALRLAIRRSIGALHPTNGTGYGSKVKMIQDAIARLPLAVFTQDDIEAELMRVNPDMPMNRNRIRAAIWSIWQKQKTIKLIRKGTNRTPAQFEILRTRRVNDQDKGQTLRSNGSPDLKVSK